MREFLLSAEDALSNGVSSEFVRYHSEKTGDEIQVNAYSGDIAVEVNGVLKDVVLVAEISIPELAGQFIIKKCRNVWSPWRGSAFDNNIVIHKTRIVSEQRTPLGRGARKRPRVNNDEDQATKRGRGTRAPVTAGIAYDSDAEIQGRILHAGSRSDTSASTAPTTERGPELPSPSSRAQAPCAGIHRGDEDNSRTQEAEIPFRGASQDMKQEHDIEAGSLIQAREEVEIVGHQVTQACKEANTRFVFIDRDTSSRCPRAFHLCCTLSKLFRFAQLTNTITPSSENTALAVRGDGVTKCVGQGDDEDGFQDMVAAISGSQCWISADEDLKCEVEVRELVLG